MHFVNNQKLIIGIISSIISHSSSSNVCVCLHDLHDLHDLDDLDDLHDLHDLIIKSMFIIYEDLLIFRHIHIGSHINTPAISPNVCLCPDSTQTTNSTNRYELRNFRIRS